MSIRDLTKEKHKEAENHQFSKLLMSGGISASLYASYLFQMKEIYESLEKLGSDLNLFLDIEHIKRYNKICQDLSYFDEQNVEYSKEILQNTISYKEYLNSIYDDKVKILAHIYVRHVGDLFGGQMISKKIPGPGYMYQFDSPVQELIPLIKNKITDDLADEANLAFTYNISIFDNLI